MQDILNQLVKGAFLAAFTLSGFSAEYISVTDQNVLSFINTSQLQTPVSLQKNTQWALKTHIHLPNNTYKNKYLQYYQGIPVLSASITSSEINQKEKNWQGQHLVDIEQDINSVIPQLSAEQVLNLVQAKDLERQLKITSPHTQLWIYQNEATQKAELIYWVSYLAYENNHVYRPHYFVQANTGEIIKAWDGLTTRDAVGPGGNEKIGGYYYGRDGLKSLNVSEDCHMQNAYVETYDLKHTMRGGLLFQFSCPENTYKSINGALSPLNDAHFNAGEAYDMFRDWYEIVLSPRKLRINVHVGRNYENAFWDGQQIFLGDGGTHFYPFTNIDTIAHEIAHGVTEKNSNLIYTGASGAINESFSDMAGEMANYYVNQKQGKINLWLIGWATTKGSSNKAMRYFSDPTKDGHSIAHTQNFQPKMDVHYASGIFNKAFYLLSHRREWDIKKTFQTFLLANLIYWKPNSNFDQAACGVYDAAVDFGFSTQDILDVFNTVGVNAKCN